MRRFCWVTLEPEDNDPVTLMRYILMAMSSHLPSPVDAWMLLDRPQPDLKGVVGAAVNHLLDVPGRLVLVLDDYHVITNPGAHETIQYLIDHLPRSIQIALGTRTRPPLSLSALESAGMVLDIGRNDLRFTPDETSRAIAMTHHELSAEQSFRVHERTEGWPVGVYLAARSRIASTSSAVEHEAGVETVHRYMDEQVLGLLPSEERQALMEWSILGRLTGDLCDRVTGRRDGAEMLVRLARTNRLLIPVDRNHVWYRFHDMLRDALRWEWGHMSEGDRNAAHLRASEWFIERGFTREGIDHAIDGRAHQRAGELIGAHWYDIFMRGGGETLRAWFDRLPSSAFDAYPPMLIPAAWTAAFSGDVDETLRYSTAARRVTFDGPMPDGSASYASGLAILTAGLGHDGMAQASVDAETAFDLEPADSPWRSLACAMAGVTRFGIGDFSGAQAALEESIGAAPSQADTLYSRGQLALLDIQQQNWTEARRHAEIACAAVEELQIGDILASGAAQAAAAAIAANDGQHGLARTKLQALSPVMAKLSDAIPFDAFQIHLVAAETYLAIGEPGAAAIHAETARRRLAAFGDAGIFEARMARVVESLEHTDPVIDLSGEIEIDLTDRECEVLALLPTDMSLREIGEELFVSRNTAKTHLTNVYRKLGVSSRSAAVTRARELDLMSERHANDE